jgi:hypothetical protein
MNKSGQHPIGEVTRVLQMLRSPTLSEIYATILRLEGPTVGEISTHVDCALSTVYRYVNRLENMSIIRRTDDRQPHRFEVGDVCIDITTPNETYQIDPLLVAASARRTANESVASFVEDNGIEGLAAALEVVKTQVTSELDVPDPGVEVEVPDPVFDELRDVVVEHRAGRNDKTVQSEDSRNENSLV